MNLEWSVGAGGLLGLCYAGASILVVNIAQRTSKFVPVVLGGMILRMFVALATLVLIIQLFPVVLPALTGTFLFVALIGLFIELVWLIRRQN